MTLELTELDGDVSLTDWAEMFLHRLYDEREHLSEDTWQGDDNYDLNLYDTEIFGSGKPGRAFTVYPVSTNYDGDLTTDTLNPLLRGIVKFND